MKYVICISTGPRLEVVGYLSPAGDLVGRGRAKQFDTVLDAATAMAQPEFDKVLGDRFAQIVEAHAAEAA